MSTLHTRSHLSSRLIVPALALAAGTGLMLSSLTVAAAADPGDAAGGIIPRPWVEMNGRAYHVRKGKGLGEGGREGVHLFHDGQREFTWEQLQAHIAVQPPQKVTAYLDDVLGRTPDHESVDVIVVLRNQPGALISRAVWGRIGEERDAIASAMRRITARPLQRPSLPEFIERDFVPLPLTRAELEERRALGIVLSELEREARGEIHARIAEAIATDQDEVAIAILQLGGAVTARITAMNVLGASLTPGAIRELAGNPLVAQIDFDHPGEPELDNSRLALMVDTGFWANDITGGPFNVGVLDTGVQMDHPALSSHGYISNMGASDTGDHGTHVAGIMVSTNAVRRGMAWGAGKIIFALAGNISVSMPGMDFIASTGEADVCNYSFSNGTASGNDYTNTDRFFDGVISHFGFLVSKSAGNGGFGTGDPTITHPAPAFNLLAVGNINDENTPARSDDWIASSSSRGPTAGGRKKPDITAPGSSISSTNADWAGGSHFVNKSGTSMAAPHVGAAVLLLYDMGVNNPMAAKAVLINTADATEDNNTSGTGDDFRVNGSRWNRRYGWGYMHLGKAYLNGLDYFVDTVATDSPRARFQLYAGQMFDHEKATLVWERHVAYNGAAFPTQFDMLSDLDLYAYRESSGAMVASSISAIDNVEQISIPAGQGGQTVLKVEVFGSFSQGIEEETFALATQENFTARNGPSFDIDVSVPASVQPQSSFTIRADVLNNGDLVAHDITVMLDGAHVTAGANPVIVSSLAPGASVPVEWTVSAAQGMGGHQFSVSVVSNSYGEEFSASEESSYIVGEGEVVISNMPGNDATQSSRLSEGRIKAMGFITPPDARYTLNQVHLRLDVPDTGADLLVRIFDDVDGLPATPLVALDNPFPLGTGAGTYTFSPPGPFTLESGRQYWLVVYNQQPAEMHWLASDPSQMPAGIAMHAGSLWNSDTGPNPPVSPSEIINTYAILGEHIGEDCYANCSGSGTEPVLTIADFACFIEAFNAAQSLPHEEQITHYANCDGSTRPPVLSILDFVCFIDAYARGCP